jgi:hypothetical protein
VIAGTLALGYRTADLKDFYMRLAPRVFRRPFWRVIGWHAKFDAEALRREIQAVVGDRTLDSNDLITGICVIAKRMDTGSPWIISNNPKAPYWMTPDDKAFIGNRHYRLGNLVRASTAAPGYFDPELLPIVPLKIPHNSPCARRQGNVGVTFLRIWGRRASYAAAAIRAVMSRYSCAFCASEGGRQPGSVRLRIAMMSICRATCSIASRGSSTAGARDSRRSSRRNVAFEIFMGRSCIRVALSWPPPGPRAAFRGLERE